MSPWAFLKRGFLKLVFAEPRKGAVEGRDEQSLGSLRSHLRHRLAFISVSEGHVTCHYLGLKVMAFSVEGDYFLFELVSFPNGKESACNAEDPGSIPGLGRSLGEGNGNPLQYSCLGNPMDRGAWGATVHG